MMDVSGRVLAITQALGDPLRLAVLQHLMGGPASVSELMTVVGAEQSRLSNHLAVLRERGLVRASRHGRQVLYELHDRAVARLIESLAQIGGPPTRAVKSAPVAHARTCYDHVAGRLGVAIFEALVAGGALKTQKAAPGGPAALPHSASHRWFAPANSFRARSMSNGFSCRVSRSHSVRAVPKKSPP